jgi:hypothetical protein
MRSAEKASLKVCNVIGGTPKTNFVQRFSLERSLSQ